jgi:hypothetical protein
MLSVIHHRQNPLESTNMKAWNMPFPLQLFKNFHLVPDKYMMQNQHLYNVMSLFFVIVFACSNVEPRCECQDIHVNCTNLHLEQVPPDIEEEITWLWVHHFVNCDMSTAREHNVVLYCRYDWFGFIICFSHLAGNLINTTFSEDTFVRLDRLLYL